jgi:hypothetical protein
MKNLMSLKSKDSLCGIYSRYQKEQNSIEPPSEVEVACK